MKGIQEKHPHIFERWLQEVQLDPVEMKSSDLEEISIEKEITNRLKQALVDKNLGGDNQGKNYRYLTSSIGNWEQLDAQLNLVKNLLEPYKGLRLSKEEVNEKAQLRI